jgi:hypothetical protein
MGKEDEIRIIAYSIWEQEGCIHGHDCEHWLKAEVIWEEKQKQKAVVKSTKTEPKQAVKPSPTVMAAKKK